MIYLSQIHCHTHTATIIPLSNPLHGVMNTLNNLHNSDPAHLGFSFSLLCTLNVWICIPTVTPSTDTNPTEWFQLQSLAGTHIRMCYGCNSPICTDTTTVPPPPHDMVIAYKERGWYRDPHTQTMKLTSTAENTYYHFTKVCATEASKFHPSHVTYCTRSSSYCASSGASA